MQGVVKSLNDDKGFGFIIGEDGQNHFFGVDGSLHDNKWAERDNKMSLDLSSNAKGPEAINVRVV